MTTQLDPPDLTGKLDIHMFPDSVINLQRELYHPFHAGLHLRMQDNHTKELQTMKDQIDYMVILATEIDMVLDGEYTLTELADKLFKELRYNRLHNTVIDSR